MSRLHLICLPYAGGTSSIYSGWGRLLPPWVKVHAPDFPGHGIRRLEPSISDWPSLVACLLRQLGNIPSEPCAIFGHSMGALVALELAHAIREKGAEPVWLGLAACRAPSRRELELHWLQCPEQEVLDELRSLGGTPDELLDNRELVDLILPVIRNDFHLCGSYRPKPRELLKCPISVFGGTNDDDVSHPQTDLTAWQEETSGPCFVTMLDGDHFFIESNRTETLAAISGALSTLKSRVEGIHA